jgi:protein TonB
MLPDRSAPAHIARVDWICPWPKQADALDINHAIVHLEVEVTEDGRAVDAHVLDESGPGFGSEALRCAMTKPYTPALDRSGRPTRGSTRPFAVRFDRFHAAR